MVKSGVFLSISPCFVRQQSFVIFQVREREREGEEKEKPESVSLGLFLRMWIDRLDEFLLLLLLLLFKRDKKKEREGACHLCDLIRSYERTISRLVVIVVWGNLVVV